MLNLSVCSLRKNTFNIKWPSLIVKNGNITSKRRKSFVGLSPVGSKVNTQQDPASSTC